MTFNHFSYIKTANLESKYLSFMGLTLFDIIVLSIILLFTIHGIFKGFINSFLSLIRWIICFYITANLSYLLLPLTRKYIFIEFAAKGIASVITFIGCFIIITIINHMIIDIFKTVKENYIDKFFGALFGAFKACFLSTMVYMIIMISFGAFKANYDKDIHKYVFKIDNSKLTSITSSKTNLFFLEFSKIIVRILPHNVWEKIQLNSNFEEEKKDINRKNEGLQENSLQEKQLNENIYKIMTTKITKKLKENPEILEKIITSETNN